jgi:excisionase family DNA binding protein
MIQKSDVLNVQEAARLLGVHIETIRRLARTGGIPAFKVGRGWRIRVDSLLKWSDTQQVQRPQPSVLVVDDDKWVQTTFRRILEKQGCRFIEAAGGNEALDILDHEKVDAVFLDLMMPAMTGPEVLQELRKKNIEVPVTLITGYPDSDLVMEAGRYGPVTLLVKPVEKAQLLQALQRMLPELRVPVEQRGNIVSAK